MLFHYTYSHINVVILSVQYHNVPVCMRLSANILWDGLKKLINKYTYRLLMCRRDVSYIELVVDSPINKFPLIIWNF